MTEQLFSLTIPAVGNDRGPTDNGIGINCPRFYDL